MGESRPGNPPKDRPVLWPAEAVSVTLFGKRVSADVIKALKMRPSWTTWVSTELINYKLINYKGKEGEIWDTGETRREGGNMMMEAETEVRCLQTKECQGLPTALWSWKQRQERIVPLKLWRNTTLLTPWFWTSGLQNWKSMACRCLSQMGMKVQLQRHSWGGEHQGEGTSREGLVRNTQASQGTAQIHRSRSKGPIGKLKHHLPGREELLRSLGRERPVFGEPSTGAAETETCPILWATVMHTR